jgi:hypothetical protein
LIESSDIVSDLLQADLVQAEASLVEPVKIAVQVVGVCVDGTGRCAELGC